MTIAEGTNLCAALMQMGQYASPLVCAIVDNGGQATLSSSPQGRQSSTLYGKGEAHPQNNKGCLLATKVVCLHFATTHLPNTVCLLSSQLHGTVVMKN